MMVPTATIVSSVFTKGQRLEQRTATHQSTHLDYRVLVDRLFAEVNALTLVGGGRAMLATNIDWGNGRHCV